MDVPVNVCLTFSLDSLLAPVPDETGKACYTCFYRVIQMSPTVAAVSLKVGVKVVVFFLYLFFKHTSFFS